LEECLRVDAGLRFDGGWLLPATRTERWVDDLTRSRGGGGRAGEVRDDRLQLRATRTARMKVEAQSGQGDVVGAQPGCRPQIDGGGLDQFLLPGARDEKDEFAEAARAHALADLEQQVVGRLGIDAEERERRRSHPEAHGR